MAAVAGDGGSRRAAVTNEGGASVKVLRPGDPVCVGPYRLAARLGSGGMGVVYLGVDGGGRQAAVKVLRDDYAEDPDFRRRFGREVSAASSVDSPRVARLLEADPDAEAPWLAAEYVPGFTLMAHIGRHGPLSPHALLELAIGLAAALNAIHQVGVVHRDLKPSNVMLPPDGPKVIDFGIAAGLPGTMTATGIILGSVGYMAPEMLTTQTRPGPAADIFSWALTVAFAATGRTPFGDGPLEALLHRTVHSEPKLTGVAGPLRAVLTAGLCKRPEHRPDAPRLLAELAALRSSAQALTVTSPRPELQVSASISPPASPGEPASSGPFDELETLGSAQPAGISGLGEGLPGERPAGPTNLRPGARMAVWTRRSEHARPSRRQGLLFGAGMLGATAGIAGLLVAAGPETTPSTASTQPRVPAAQSAVPPVHASAVQVTVGAAPLLAEERADTAPGPARPEPTTLRPVSDPVAASSRSTLGDSGQGAAIRTPRQPSAPMPPSGCDPLDPPRNSQHSLSLTGASCPADGSEQPARISGPKPGEEPSGPHDQRPTTAGRPSPPSPLAESSKDKRNGHAK
ncbi:serine/threonine-protein kinase [Parafrankia discariae]|uniref:serine/threonine-protein kinase n=1 Tax=Parafrankia discariae TaxID=365528 RepID=UPI000A046785|nr:serine/threonine-protein kinase [Parafrankia discariae]